METATTDSIMTHRYATTAEELTALLTENPGQSPSMFLRDDSFAAHCYDRFSARELKSAFHRDPDPDQCTQWRLTSGEWKENVALAYAALIARDSGR